MLSSRVNHDITNSSQRHFSSFTLLPSLASSRPPASIPNSSISQSRNLDHPLIFDNDYGLLINWYNEHKKGGSTTIHKMQLRKEHRSPSHEFIMVLTRGDRAYRVDRSRDGPVLDTVMEQGVPPYDTITPLQSTSLQELDETSYCMVELCWGDDKTIDLLLVLNICFQIHDESGKRYKLLTHNCYFFSQTIIMIVVRKTVACRAELDKVLKRGICDRTWQLCWEDAWKSANSNLVLEPGKLLGKTLRTELGPELGLVLGSELGLVLGWALKRVLELDLRKALKDLKGAAGDLKRDFKGAAGNLKRDLEEAAWEDPLGGPLARRRSLKRVLGWVLGWVRTQERAQERVRERQRERERQLAQEQRREKVRQREQELQREQLSRSQQQGQWQGEQLRQRLQQLQVEWEHMEEREQALEQAQKVLGEVLELALSGELEPNWHKKRGDPNTLAKTIPNKLVCVCVGWTIEHLGRIVIRKVEEAPFLDGSFPGLLEFPASFVVSSKVTSDAPSVRIEKYKDLEGFMKGIIERHVDSVPLPEGSKHDLRAEILNGMKRTWSLVSPLSSG